MVMPALVDIWNAKYNPVGFGLEGMIGQEKWQEFAYSTKGAGKPGGSSGRVVILDKKGKISRMVFYYLIKHVDEPGGIIGVRTRARRDEVGDFWPLAGGIDYVKIAGE